MILICGDPADEVAQGVYRRLQSQGADVCLVASADLVYAPYWRHELTAAGAAITEIRLQNGTVIESHKVETVFNRLWYLEAIHFLNEPDRQYAEMELLALYISFLKGIEHALPAPMQLGQMNPEGLSELQLKAAAIAAGVPVADLHITSSPKWKHIAGMMPMSITRPSKDAFYRRSPHLIWEDRPVRQIAAVSSSTRVTIVGDRVFGEAELPFKAALLRLAQSLGCLHMDALIGEAGNGLCLLEADTAPRHASAEVLAAIAGALLLKSLQPV